MVLPALDYCNDPAFAIEVQREEEKTLTLSKCCWKSSRHVSVSARIPASAWCPGEVVPVMAHVRNFSDLDLENVSCSLVAHALFMSGTSSARGCPTLKERVLLRVIHAGEEIRHRFLVRIPPCPPSFSLETGRLISVEYAIRISVFDTSIVELPITIGTIPHRSQPLFPEQMNDEQQSMVRVFSWANPDDITGMAAACCRSGTQPFPAKYRNVAVSEPRPSFHEMKYVYFEMPAPDLSSSAKPGGDRFRTPGDGEMQPLLGGSSRTTPGCTELRTVAATTTSIRSSTTSSSFEAPTSIFKYAEERYF